MFFWSKRKNKKISATNQGEITPTPLNSSLSQTELALEPENNDSIEQPKQYWQGFSIDSIVGEMLNDQMKKGAFDNLPGKGKPIDISSGDVLNSTLKNANVLPNWLALQHEIRDQIAKLLSIETNDQNVIETELNNINQKIIKYNNMVPSSILQKRKITKENMKEHYNLWV
ncbi:DUF1992 domain-containing protein [Paenibacillus sediminis]|uniref:DnaJ homologue subfamily C member 28 conserved domain-containing protein n=1 Tax=Paenibacillus sediminis TaxID=664909 RepID=A0ABS4H4R3_9BACL|nr:DUF1992 domain-containing protein [Paenibacillus sediminis]MBP1937466.1 hypothetical protein [Paenibacillus sediminis]